MEKSKVEFLKSQGIYISDKRENSEISQGKVLFMFPGHGSLYSGILRALSNTSPIVQRIFEVADIKYKKLTGHVLSEYIFENSKEKYLERAEIMQPAILAVNHAIYNFLKSNNVLPDILVGHSFGEFSALVAGGVIDFEQGIEMAYFRAKVLDRIPANMRGKMLSIKFNGNKKDVEEVIHADNILVHKALKNAETQIVYSGIESEIQKLERVCEKRGIINRRVHATHAFHSPVLETAVAEFQSVLQNYKFNAPKIPIFSSISNSFYPKDKSFYEMGDISKLLAKQFVTSFEYSGIVDELYKKYNVRYFIEVGGKSILTNLVKEILEEKTFWGIATNQKNVEDEIGIKRAIAYYHVYHGI